MSCDTGLGLEDSHHPGVDGVIALRAYADARRPRGAKKRTSPANRRLESALCRPSREPAGLTGMDLLDCRDSAPRVG